MYNVDAKQQMIAARNRLWLLEREEVLALLLSTYEQCSGRFRVGKGDYMIKYLSRKIVLYWCNGEPGSYTELLAVGESGLIFRTHYGQTTMNPTVFLRQVKIMAINEEPSV